MNLFLLAILGVAAMAPSVKPQVQQQADPVKTEEILVAGNNQFTAKMFAEVVKNNPNKSVVLSAFSVLFPLAQLAMAAEAPTHDELLKAIGLPNDNVTRDVISLVNKKVRSIKGVDLKMANRIYIPDGEELNESFKAVSRDVFDSEVTNINFGKNVEAAAAINSWVEDHTNHRIKDLVEADSLSPNTRAVLVNAIYFKGKWKTPFQVENTVPRDFYVSKDKTIKVPTMNRKGDYAYAESQELDAKLLRLPYEGDEASMLLVLPNKVDGLAELEEKLKDPAALTKATENMYTFEVDVFLPQFRIETTTNLKNVLLNMSVMRIFSSVDAQLNNLIKGDTGLFVSQAIQKAFIEVNEEGAEAAAANEFMMPVRMMVTPPNREFIANHPFYLALQINKATLFIGKFIE